MSVYTVSAMMSACQCARAEAARSRPYTQAPGSVLHSMLCADDPCALHTPSTHTHTLPPPPQAGHPLEGRVRQGTRGPEFAKPITIGSDTWIGGNAIMLPGALWRRAAAAASLGDARARAHCAGLA